MTDDEHLRDDQLFALMWAIKDRPPPAEGEGADPELARAMRSLSDAYEAPLAVEHRLGPETVARLMAHTTACKPCRMKLLEDAPGAGAPRTQSDIVAEAQRKEDARRRLVVRFWLGASGGLVTFVAAQFVFQLWRDRQRVEAPEGTTLQRDPSEKTREIDPLIFGGMALVLVAAFLIADAYTIARELWIDFTRWKQAVPVIGKAWAARDKRRQQDGEG
ncbi:MAG: hypothetical protein M9894_02315 [Planctomycetes bacterium]|nr:hypothetical protein [Planctomycetota bacterium]